MKALVRLDASTRLHSSSVYSCGCLRMLMPALFTRMSRRPRRRAASSTIARQARSSATSVAMLIASAPSCLAALAFFSASRPAIASFAPARSSYLGSPFPLPQARVLYEIGRRGECTASALGADLDIDLGYLSRLIQGLKRQRLVQGEPALHDARHIRLTLA